MCIKTIIQIAFFVHNTVFSTFSPYSLCMINARAKRVNEYVLCIIDRCKDIK